MDGMKRETPPVTFTLTHPPTSTFPTVAHCLAWSHTQPLTFQRRLPVASSPHLTSPHLTPPPATQRNAATTAPPLQPTNQPTFLLSSCVLCSFVRSFVRSSLLRCVHSSAMNTLLLPWLAVTDCLTYFVCSVVVLLDPEHCTRQFVLTVCHETIGLFLKVGST